MKNANKAETSKEAKALRVVAKAEKKSRAKGKANAGTVEQVNALSRETIGLDVGHRVSQFCRLDAPRHPFGGCKSSPQATAA
jgi:hypothetical protein